MYMSNVARMHAMEVQCQWALSVLLCALAIEKAERNPVPESEERHVVSLKTV